tara:strand:+ start:420 stop:896 length:477 start_codon:yes stop_codon:yes gene_type:complete
MCNQLPKYGVLIAFLSLFQMAKAQDRTDEFNEKSPFELKFYADTVEIDIQEGIPNDVAKLNVKVLPKLNFENSSYQGWRFQVSEWVATLVSKGVGRQSVKGTGPRMQVYFGKVQKGDLVVVEFKGIYFIDPEGNKGEFTDDEIDAVIGRNAFSLPLIP